MRKIFISYHHKREQEEKNKLAQLINDYAIFLDTKDMSVKMGDIEPSWPDNKIAKIIREEYLKDTSITILILGTHTKCRKHIDWEIESSLSKYGSLNRRSKINGLIILETSEFIKKSISDNDEVINYHSLITEANSGKRIYEIVKSGYAIVSSFDEIFSDIRKLKTLLDESEIRTNNENILFQTLIKTNETDKQQALEHPTTVKNKSKNKNLLSKFLTKFNLFNLAFLHKKNNSEDCPNKNSENKTQFYYKKNKNNQLFAETKIEKANLAAIELELQNQKIKRSTSVISL